MNKVPLGPALDIVELSWESERLDVVDGFPVELPPSGRGLRAQRRRQQARRRRRHRLGLGALAVSIVALLAAGLVEATWRSHTGGSVSGAAAPATRAVGPVPPTAVLVQQDASGAAASITLLVAGPGGRGGHVLMIPPGTMTELPSFGLDGLGRSLALGGPPLLQNALENLFGVKLDPVTVLRDPQLAALVRPAGPLTVDLPARVESIDAGNAGSDVYRVRQSDLDSVLKSALPGAPVGRVRVQILNGSGALGVAEQVASRLVPTGARVVLTGNADSFAYRQTQVVFYERSKQAAALAVQKALGAGRLVFSRRPLDVVDVTLVIGKDFKG